MARSWPLCVTLFGMSWHARCASSTKVEGAFSLTPFKAVRQAKLSQTAKLLRMPSSSWWIPGTLTGLTRWRGRSGRSCRKICSSASPCSSMPTSRTDKGASENGKLGGARFFRGTPGRRVPWSGGFTACGFQIVCCLLRVSGLTPAPI